MGWNGMKMPVLELTTIGRKTGQPRTVLLTSPIQDGADIVVVASRGEALVSDAIPYTSFAVDDVATEFARLSQFGVRFTQEPVELGPVTTAVFDDTCGNLIQLTQLK
jgi:F420H(2)-dependent quinone reductase